MMHASRKCLPSSGPSAGAHATYAPIPTSQPSGPAQLNLTCHLVHQSSCHCRSDVNNGKCEYRLMAVGSVLRDAAPKVGACPSPSFMLQRTQGLIAETPRLEVLTQLAGGAWSGNSQTFSGGKTVLPEEQQDLLWKEFFSDSSEWWDNRRSKRSSRHPDFKHKKSKLGLWVDSRHKPAWVDLELARWDAGKHSSLQSLTTSAQGWDVTEAHEDQLEVGVCRELCEDGRITEGVNLLNRLVRRGCRVPNRLFYCFLKRCNVAKDLVLGMRIHTLTVESGYEGDAFLATHLIGLYASHGRLEEARQVFSKVPAPSAQNWATIIFAYARHGEAAQAIRLYRQMREAAVEPDNRIYSAVLKACAAAGDLSVGKEVHAHILASPKKPDIFVQNGLMHMYSKCGSVEHARRIFDKITDRNVVTWTTMIAGYAQLGMGQEALSLYSSMQQEGLAPPDSVTFVCLLQACASVGVAALHRGKKLHAQIEERGLENDAILSCSLVNMYAKCGDVQNARTVFENLTDRSVTIWNAMIAGYVQQGMGHQALTLYKSMQQEGLSPPISTFACLLQACANAGEGALHDGKQLHARLEREGLEQNLVVGGSLINMYTKCGSLEDARIVFDKLQERDVVIWTAMIAGYGLQGMGLESVKLYNCMRQEGLSPPDSIAFTCLLQACASVGACALDEGKQLHAQIAGRGLQHDVSLGCSLVTMYAKCGSLEDARSVFDNLPEKNVATWTAMIAGYAQQGMGREALRIYSSMQQERSFPPNAVTFVCLLQACAKVGVEALSRGRQFHAQIREQGLHDDWVLGGSLVDMYAKCGSLEDAQEAFEKLSQKNTATWNAMLAGYVEHGMGEKALTIYNEMQRDGHYPPDSATFTCLLQACASIGVGALHKGKQLQAQIREHALQNDLVLGCSLVNMYTKCGSMDEARGVFEGLPEKNVVTWNAMLAGYAQHGMGEEVLDLHRCMLQAGLSPNLVSFICLLQACAGLGVRALCEGKLLHAQIEELRMQHDVVLGCSLVDMYAKCGSIVDARRVFDRLPDRSSVTWTVMIAGYAQQGMGQEALSLYGSMQEGGISPSNSATFTCLLHACSSVGAGALQQGKELHLQISKRGLEDDVVVGGSLVNMYAKCGSLADARDVFDRLPDRTVLTYNAMLAGYAQQGMGQEAITLYSQMQEEGTVPDSVTYVCLLRACAIVASLPLGKHFHAEMKRNGIQADVTTGAALVNMYAKCGSMIDSQEVFDSLPERTVEAWGALIGGYTCQGDSDAVFSLLDRMTWEGIQPDDITFLSVLAVCSHAGLVEKGQHYFEAMSKDYGITHSVEHYTCMMDLLGRAGHLDEALQLAQTMPVPADGAVWLTLLGSCQKWNNVEVGQQAFDCAVKLDGNNATPYVLMSNIYARAGMWEEAKEMQTRRKTRGAWKEPGQCWWTDMAGVVHSFVVGDITHP